MREQKIITEQQKIDLCNDADKLLKKINPSFFNVSKFFSPLCNSDTDRDCYVVLNNFADRETRGIEISEINTIINDASKSSYLEHGILEFVQKHKDALLYYKTEIEKSECINNSSSEREICTGTTSSVVNISGIASNTNESSKAGLEKHSETAYETYQDTRKPINNYPMKSKYLNEILKVNKPEEIIKGNRNEGKSKL